VNVSEAIASRRSIRSFKKHKVESEKLSAILEAARLSPSARNEQQWLFIIVRQPDTLRKLAFACSDQQQVGEADTAICCCIPDADQLTDSNRFLRHQDIAVANAFMMLQATELGLGSCWIGSFNELKLKNHLRIPETVAIHSLLVIGYPHYTPPPTERKSATEIFRSEEYPRTLGE
jgi:nitroreductase